MTKRLSGLIGLTLLVFSCTNKPKIDQDLIYSTLNDIIQQDTIFAKIVCSRFDQVTIPAEIQQEFFNAEKMFIQEQIKNSAHLKIDTGQLYFYSRKKNGLEKSFIDTTCSMNIFYHLTYPVFSKDLQTVVVGITEDCKCMLGGWGFKAVYKRQNGKWKRIRKFDAWIS